MKRLFQIVVAYLSLMLQDFINLLHAFDGFKGKQELRAMAKELRSTGYVSKAGYVDPATCDVIREKILALTERCTTSTKLESGTYVSHRSESDASSADHGMVDIFDVDKEFPEIRAIDVSPVNEMIQMACNQQVCLYGVNAYVNRGVKGTRGYHIDNTQPAMYKAFIYLTDVPDTSYGPYSYVKKSQRFSFLVYWNLIRNLFVSKYHPTDMPVYNKSKVIHATGSKGDMILSHQNGIHRGLPQEDGRTRIALVYKYMILSKLSYIHKAAKRDLKAYEERKATA